MSIRWVTNVVIDGVKSVIESQLGDRAIGDTWFDNISDSREDIIAQGLDILKRSCAAATVTYPDGRPYDWQ
jgi:hypothetical protein